MHFAKSLSVWVLSWLVLKWFDELTNHIGVIKPWSFSSFYVSQLVKSKMKVCKMLRHQNSSKLLRSFSQKKCPNLFEHYYVVTQDKKKIRKGSTHRPQIAYFNMTLQHHAPTACCLTTNHAKQTWFMKVAHVMYVTMPMVDYVPLGYNRKSPKLKNSYVFHNYEKK